MCCCCPDAINALFCLYVQSGCNKGTVAGALTFFPPEPAFYRFDRYTKDGQYLEPNQKADEERPPPLEVAETHGQTQEKLKSPVQQLTEQAKERRKRANELYQRDSQDVKAGVTYKLWLDPRLPVPPFERANIECVKIPNATKSHVAAILYRCPDANEHTRTIIYSHGNAADIGAMFPIQVVLAHSLDVNVVSYDYSGYGASGGVPDENNTYKDIQAVYKWTIQNVVNGDASKIILYGQSVGSGPCCYLAARDDDLGGMVLHSPFTSGMRVLTPSRLLGCLDIYENINRISKVNCPVMVIHGKLDQEVDFHHGLELHKAVPEELQREPWWVPDRGHNDITEGPGKLTEYVRRLRGFMESL